MLLLSFRSAENRFAIDATNILEVIPRVELRAIPHAPAFIAGLLNYRGRVIHVIDFSELTGGVRSREILSTRILILQWVADSGAKESIGLIAEHVNRLHTAQPEQHRMASPRMESAPYLGAVYELEEGLVQVIEARRLLSGELRDSLFGKAEERVSG